MEGKAKIYFKQEPVNIEQLLYELRKFYETDKAINKLCDLFEYQEERITALYETIYKLAPELEIIETLADSEEEEREYISRYMNHGKYLEN